MTAVALQKASRTSTRGPALKADPSAVARSFAGSGDVASRLSHDLTGRSQSAAGVARSGFSGGGGEVPHRAEMQRSFGADLSGVRAHTGAAAAGANASLGSHAYAMGSDVAFKSTSPSPGLVAHELTHVVQQSRGPATSGGSADGIDRSGEAEARKVEAAVNAGQPASSVLGSQASGVLGAARDQAEPALAADSFGMGWTFSAEAFERSYEYTIWKTPPFLSPTPVPGLFWKIQPNVKVVGKGGVGYGGQKKGDLSVSLGVEGQVALGLSYGAPELAEVYANVAPKLTGEAKFTKKTSGWTLVGGLKLGMTGKIGVKLAKMMDFAYKFMDLELLKLTGIYFDEKGFQTSKLGLEPGKDIEPIYEAIKAGIEKAKAIGSAIADGASAAAGFVADSAGAFYDAVTSW
jgi:hypothetical protein